MAIASIETVALRHRLPRPQGNATGYVDERVFLVVRMRSDDGLEGWGETWRHPEAVAALVRAAIAPRYLGADPLDRERLFHETLASAAGYDRRGALVAALSAVDMAAWDLAARSLGVPLARLLGGIHRDAVEAYASGPFLPPPDQDAARHYRLEAARYAADGFATIKMRGGFSPRTDRTLAEAVRAGAGPDVRIAVDFNQGCDGIRAARILSAFADLDIAFAEEPVAPDDPDGYAFVGARTAIPLAGGETEATLRGFRDLLDRGVLAVVQPDLSIAGGFTECLRIRHLAEARGVRTMPHVWGTGIGVAAALHFIASTPAYGAAIDPVEPLLEWDCSDNPLRERIATRPFAFDGPRIRLPDGPGLGIAIDESVIDRHRTA